MELFGEALGTWAEDMFANELEGWRGRGVVDIVDEFDGRAGDVGKSGEKVVSVFAVFGVVDVVLREPGRYIYGNG